MPKVSLKKSSTTNQKIDAIKAGLRQTFEMYLAQTPDEALIRLVQLEDAEAFPALVNSSAKL